MSKLVTIFGGSGFVGRYIARRMAKAGWRVRVAVRRPNEAHFVRTYGSVGQVEPILANIRDDASVAMAVAGADAVVNCVGTFGTDKRNTFDAIQKEGAARIARLAANANVSQMVHISAIGADAGSPSEYGRSKAAGEAAMLQYFPKAVILRPSIIFGPEDQFFNRFAAMTRLGPALPVVGPDTKFQPVYVDDVAALAAKAAMGEARAGVYELGGPDIETFRELMERMLRVIDKRRLVLGLPFFVGRLMGWSFDMLQKVTFGLMENKMITRDQVKSLAVDNVVGEGVMTLADAGVEATDMDAVLETYLWRFRPAGQYTELMDSAKELKD